jgi:phosphomannomutase
MPLIKSISGLRGTIGGKPAISLSPVDVVKFTAAYAAWLKQQDKKNSFTVVMGRDGRISGSIHTAIGHINPGSERINVINLDLSTTPTVEMSVIFNNADGALS